jgi:Redoxin
MNRNPLLSTDKGINMFKSMILSLLIAWTSVLAQNPNPMWNTASDFRKYEPEILKLIDQVKKNPLNKETPTKSAIIHAWASGTPYIGFSVDKKYLSELDKSYSYFPLLSNAFAFGEIELKLRNPKKYSEPEIATASLKSMLGVYERVLESDVHARNPILDNYLEWDKQGQLLKHFESVQAPVPEVKANPMPTQYAAFEYGIKIQQLEGKKVAFKEWKNKDLLVLYVSAGCPHCRNLAKKMRDSLHTKMDVILLFTKSSSSGIIQEFFEDTKAPYKAFYDYDAQFREKYGGTFVPVVMLIRKDGTAIRSGNENEALMKEILDTANRL